MTTVPTVTPEHMQLFSDKRLEDTLRQSDEANGNEAERQGHRAVARAARYELARRRCEVPVRDRYSA